MKPYKAITGLTRSPSEIKRSLQSLKPAGYNMFIDQLLVIASKKLGLILQKLMESSNVEHFLNLEDYNEVKEISKLVSAIVNALKSTGLILKIKSTININMERHRNSLKNPPGYVFVNTALLLEIIELYNSLENLRNDFEILYKLIGIHSSVQTESGPLSLTNSEATNSNKIIFKLNKPLANNNNSSFALLSNDYIVMPSQSTIPLNESKSRVASSLENEQELEVKDVYGAKKVIVKCIYDLEDVSSYLGTERKDVATICSPAELVYDGPSTSKTESLKKTKSFTINEDPLWMNEMDQHTYGSDPWNDESKHNISHHHESDDEKCCCKDCIGSTGGLEDEDQVVICIKGCDENDGDIQIVIRQCPDCNKTKSSSKGGPRTSTGMTQSSKSSLKKGFSRTRLEEIESTILHNKDSLGSVICSDEEEEEERHGHIGHEERHNHIGHAECSRIELFETTNLCLQTDTGQEFVISLTVSPKDAHGFGDGSYRKSTTSIQKQTYFADDTYIPLVRTKVCSSLDFDVKTVESRLRNQGQFNNKNNKIVVRLQDFGTENLLRACRPAKCCRKAILNEKLKKCLPYSASIGSLPLDEADFDVIGESLEMSLQKVKNSTNLRKSAAYNSSNMYFNSVYSVMYLLVDDNQSLAKHKLDYYIYLVDDMRCNYANYDVYYFGVQHSFHQAENREEKQTASNRSLDKEVAPNRSNPFKWMKEKYNKYQTVLSYPQELISQNDPLITRNRRNIPESIKRNSLARNNKLYSSRIPIPVCKHEPTSESSSDRGGNGESDQIDVNDIDDASLTWQLQGFIGKKYQDSKQDRDSLGEKIAEFTEQTDKRYSICNYYEKIQNSTKSSVASNILKNKRKRKEFYLPRSSSDMSTPKQMCKLKSNTSKNKPKNPVLSTKRLTKDTSLFSLVNRDSSKLILKYFTKVLHEMIMKQMIKDKFLCQISEKHMSVAVGTEKESLQEIYRNQNIRKIRNENNSNISFHDLKAKQPQVCLTQVNSVKTLNRFNTIGMQTSRNIGQSKQSQTSNTLLDTFFQMEKNTFKRELIFKQLYNYSKQNSCDEVENFTVAFASNQSFSDCDFMTSESQLFDDNGNYTEETLEASLNKLKETLVKYEIVKREIDETTINPIEYFVYHLCACDSILNRKPTMMQRILSKTKGLFSAVENSFKLKNPICPTCGCNISNCQGQTSNAKPFLSCTCPEEFTKPKIFQPCCKKQAKTKSSTIAAQIKKSICDLFVSHKKLEPCKCTRSSQYGDAVYIPGKNSNKKNVLVGTTQKCGCVKCENFNNEDGTCCCSHCLGCLDKCFETSPENKSIAIEADVSVGLPENEKSKEVKETNAAVALVDTNHALSTIKDDLVVSDDKIVSDDRVHENEEDPGNRTDTQTYFFMGPTPQFLRSGNENPFQQYLLNFPNFSMFQVENLEDNFRR